MPAGKSEAQRRKRAARELARETAATRARASAGPRGNSKEAAAARVRRAKEYLAALERRSIKAQRQAIESNTRSRAYLRKNAEKAVSRFRNATKDEQLKYMSGRRQGHGFRFNPKVKLDPSQVEDYRDTTRGKPGPEPSARLLKHVQKKRKKLSNRR